MKEVIPNQRALLCPCCGQKVTEVRDPLRIFDMMAMPPTDRLLAECLADHMGRWVLAATLIDAVFGHRADGVPGHASKNIDVRIHYLRLRLSGTPLAIESAGRGQMGRRMVWREPRRTEGGTEIADEARATKS